MKRDLLPPILFLVSALLAAMGFRAGEAAALLQKAVNICLSCIGIG